MLSKLRIWIGATALAVLATSGGVAAVQAYDPPETSPFTDVSTGHVFYRHIAWLSDAGISTGYGTDPNRTFQPAAPVLREQMAAFLYRLAGSPGYEAPATSPFTDVSTGHVFYKQISWLAAQGISTGYGTAPHRTFQPSAPVLREQMAAFLYRFEKVSDTTPLLSVGFTDVPATHVFKRQIDWMSVRGISSGYVQGPPGFRRDFRPSDAVLREQMAAFMYRLEDVDKLRSPQVSVPTSLDLDINETLNQALTDPQDPQGVWSVHSGALPPGVGLLNRHPSQGPAKLDGWPTAVGTYTATLRYRTALGDRSDRTIVITVTDPGDVVPTNTVTRAEMADYLFRCEAPDVSLPSTSPFSDIAREDPRFPAVYWSHTTGLVPAAGAAYDPDTKLTRRAVARSVAAYARPTSYATPFHPFFIDVPNTDPDFDTIQWIAATNVMVIDNSGYFRPSLLAARADATRFQYNVTCAEDLPPS